MPFGLFGSSDSTTYVPILREALQVIAPQNEQTILGFSISQLDCDIESDLSDEYGNLDPQKVIPIIQTFESIRDEINRRGMALDRSKPPKEFKGLHKALQGVIPAMSWMCGCMGERMGFGVVANIEAGRSNTREAVKNLRMAEEAERKRQLYVDRAEKPTMELFRELLWLQSDNSIAFRSLKLPETFVRQLEGDPETKSLLNKR